MTRKEFFGLVFGSCFGKVFKKKYVSKMSLNSFPNNKNFYNKRALEILISKMRFADPEKVDIPNCYGKTVRWHRYQNFEK